MDSFEQMHSCQILPVFPEIALPKETLFTHLYFFSLQLSILKWFLLLFISPSRIHFSGKPGFETIHWKCFPFMIWTRRKPNLELWKVCQHISSSPGEAWFLFCLHLNCKIPMTNLAAWLSVSRGNRRKVVFFAYVCGPDHMEECWQVRALQKSHPCVIQILQIIYLIRRDSCKTPTYWQVLWLSAFSIFPSWWRN